MVGLSQAEQAILDKMKTHLTVNATQKKGSFVEKGKDFGQKLIGFGKQANTLFKTVPSVFEKVTNFIFLYEMYKLALKTPDEVGPKIVTIWLFICSFSTYVLTYSCVLNNLLQNRTYESYDSDENQDASGGQNLARNAGNAIQFMIKVLMLTLFGPFFIIIIEIFEKLKKCIDLFFSIPPMIFFGGEKIKGIAASLFRWINYSCFNLNSA
jgi:hypothetical protein